MNNIGLLLILVIVLVSFAYVYLSEIRRDKAEVNRFREVIRGIKSRDVVEYQQSENTEGDLPGQKEEEYEIQELDQTDPIELVKAINKEHEN